jgi:ubiquinone/menaquinone biosynthesis C-methylase UbiE
MNHLKKPLISIVLPISDKAPKGLVKSCLKSIENQTYQNFELLIITSKQEAKRLSSITSPFRLKIITGNYTKSQARNLGTQKALGEYLLHLDHDLELPPTILADLAQKAKRKSQAVVIPVKVETDKSLIEELRAFEHQLILGNQELETPIFFNKSLLKKVGGFNPKLDPLDDWGIHLALKEEGVKFDRIKTPLILRPQTQIKILLKRRYQRGQAVPRLKEKYPQPPQLSLKKRVFLVFGKWPHVIKSPFLAGGLLILKSVEFFAFFLGSLNPKRDYPKSKDVYQLAKIAKDYDQQRLGNNFGRYKHYAETRALFKLLEGKQGEILEIGCGTGRITQELVKRGFKITPADPSKAMLSQFKKKTGLPRPFLASGENLPFSQNQFPIVLGIRVIWHILSKKRREKVFSEAARVSQKYLIFDFTNRQRTENLLVKIGEKLYEAIARPLVPLHSTTYFFDFSEIEKLAKKEGFKISAKIPLDVTSPIWLNLFPQKFVTLPFPLLCCFDQAISGIIPPSRFLILFEKKA